MSSLTCAASKYYPQITDEETEFQRLSVLANDTHGVWWVKYIFEYKAFSYFSTFDNSYWIHEDEKTGIVTFTGPVFPAYLASIFFFLFGRYL